MKGLLGKQGSGSDKAPEGAGQDETEDLSSDEGNLLLNLISQLRPGMELSRITFPTFVLEPRSMLERITDFLAHPDLIFGAGKIEDANERFIAVLTYYLAGWHIKPKGVKKPYNPILGEIFRCRYKYQDGTQGYYIAEQVSHHPPISAFYYCSPENKIEVFGELKPKSRFLGNSAANEMGGYNHCVFLDRPEDGEYDISMPNMYARGILFGKMVLELGDIAKVFNNNTHMHCDVDFKTKGFFSGSYNTIHGKIKSSKGEIGEISGKWSDQMYIQRGKNGDKQLMFDATSATTVPKTVAPESEQDENESRRLWSKVTQAIKKNDQDAATDEKSAIEDRQREIAKMREDAGERWAPKYFALKNDEHRAIFKLPNGDVKDQMKAVETWIFGSQEVEEPERHTEKGETSARAPEAAATPSSVPAPASTSGPAPAPASQGTAPPATSEPAKPVAATPVAAPAVPSGSVHTQSTVPVRENTTTSTAPAPASPATPATKKEHHSFTHSKPIAMAAAAMGLGGSSHGSSGSSPEGHGHLGFLKRGQRKTNSNAVPGNATDGEASSRQLP